MTDPRTRCWLIGVMGLALAHPIWATGSPFSVDIAGYIGSDEIQEASGLAASRRTPGVLWTHNDKGDPARLFALNLAGRLLVTCELAEGVNVDFEDIAVGPGPQGGVDYVYIGDIGDNDAVRPFVRIYRIPEPSVAVNRLDAREVIVSYDALVLHYPDGPRDAETLMIDPWTADLYLVTKAAEPTEIYRAPYPQAAEMTLERVAGLEADWGVSEAGCVGPTSGDIAPDGRQVLIRGHHKAFLWKVTRPGSPLWEVFGEVPEEVPLGWEEQGEALAFAADSRAYFTTSEGPWCALYYYTRSVPDLIGPTDINNDGVVNFLDYADLAARAPSNEGGGEGQTWAGLETLADSWLQIINQGPTDILPSAVTVARDTPSGIVVAHLQAEDPDVRDLHRYSLVSGEGDQDNPCFRVHEGLLITAEVLSRPIGEHYSLRIRCEDRVGHSLEKALRVEVEYDPYLIRAGFAFGTEDFEYLDDAFRHTAQPIYAQGSWDPWSGDPNGALTVRLGGLDKEDIDGISGGWHRSFAVPENPLQWVLGFSYRLWTHEEYGNSEFTEVLVSLDGALVPGASHEAVDRLSGGGDTGWRSVQIPLGVLAPGPHHLTLGAYNNRKTKIDEVSELFLDNVRVCPAGWDL